MVSRFRLTTLLASTAVAGVIGVSAHAQTVAQTTSATTTSAKAATSAPATAAAPAAEAVSVTGRTALTRSPGAGLMRVETAPKSVQTITRDFISKQSPTTNIQMLLSTMPSANVLNADPFGLFSGATYIRGLDQTNIGWTLDGMPLNDIGGGQFYSNEVLEAEDLETVSLEPGSVDLDSPVVSGAAGLVKATMSAPTHKMGGLMDVSFGSFDMTREFLRLNSGDIGNSGVRFMFSFSHTKANNYRGPGDADKFHYDFKLVKDFANGSHTGLTVSYNHQVNDSYLNPSLSQYRATGYSTNYAADYAGVNSAGTNYYKLHVNPFQNVVAVLPSHIVITPKLSIDDSAYFWYGAGNGTGASLLTEGSTYYGGNSVPIDLTGNGTVTRGTQAIALTPSNQEQYRPGNTIKVNYELDRHNHLTAGWWYEYANLAQWSPVGMVNQTTGLPDNIWGTTDTYRLPNGQAWNYRDFLSLSQTNTLFIGDSMNYFHDHLHVDIGFKESMMTRRVYNYVPNSTYNRNLHTAEPLPQLGIAWQFNKQHQIYISAATNYKVPSNTSLVDYYSNTSAARTQVGQSTSPEYSISEELGYRYNGDIVIGSVSFFNYNFTNRQLTQNTYVGGASYSTSINAGGQTSRGVDVQLATRPIWFHLRPYASFEYLHSTIDNNIATTGTLNGVTVNDLLRTKGKEAVNAPKIQANLGLDYDDGHLFVGAQLHYTGKQQATFMNDSKLPQFLTNNIYMGYRFKSIGYLKSPQIQLNMSNITNAKFRSGIYTIQTNYLKTTGVHGSAIASSGQPAYYLNAPFTAVVTLSTAF